MTIPNDLPPAHDPERERPHRPADDREEIYFQGAPLLRGEIGRVTMLWIVGLLVLVAPFIWNLLMDYWPDWWFWLACLIVAGLIFVLPILFTKSIRYRVSNYRIDYERGILVRKIDTLELWHVEDISFQQSLIERMLGVGTITVLSHDESTPRLELSGIPRPRPLFDALKQRIIAVKRQRGVIKMDIGGNLDPG